MSAAPAAPVGRATASAATSAPPAPARHDGPAAARGAPTLGQLLRYGGLGLPLAFVALPLVVQWPAYAADQWGLPLAVLGALLLAVRVADALVDPWIGRRADGWFARSASGPWRALVVAALLLLAGFAGLFFAPSAWVGQDSGTPRLLVWSTVALLLTYLGYSLAQVVHQAWAARLGGDAVERSRWVGAREGFALAGVLSASVLPSLAGWAVTGIVLALLLALGLWGMHGLPTLAASPPGPAAADRGTGGDDDSPWAQRPFRSLLAIYTLNGLAASIPASLVLFFVRDRVQAPAIFEALFLAAYFGAAALGVPMWVRAVRRFGLVRAWALGMALSIAAFVGAVLVGAGDIAAFAAICVASGLALGADLVAPPALLAGVIQASGVHGRAEGRWFGWWSMATKLTLALAAGISLPLVQALGYAPGSREPAALQALAVVYAVVPCAVKALTLALLWRCRHHWTADAAPSPSAPSPLAETRSR